MARELKDLDENRECNSRKQRFRRERPWGYDDPYAGRSRSLAGDYGRRDESRDRTESAFITTLTDQDTQS